MSRLPAAVAAFFSILLLDPRGTALAADPTTDNAADLLNLTKTCATHLSGAYATDDGGAKNTYICGDRKNVVYWTADMDIDCDGAVTSACNVQADPWFQEGTAFGDNVQADKVPYFVIPNNFNLGSNGIGGGQIAAIIYKGKLTYAVLADTGPAGIIGEASYATAKLLGIDPDPETGGTDGPVTYIVFTGTAPRAGITEAAHQDALTKGKAAADQFIKDNGGPTGFRVAQAAPGVAMSFRALGRTLEVDGSRSYSIRVMDSRGRAVRFIEGAGSSSHTLADLVPGVYRAETVSGGTRRNLRFVLF
ncbi:MAG: hypothetical protein JWP91_1158 [Fibrobacteres bacterium]|nr:hypothetical protein [Fibrobacterota bacterium]